MERASRSSERKLLSSLGTERASKSANYKGSRRERLGVASEVAGNGGSSDCRFHRALPGLPRKTQSRPAFR